MSIIYEKFKKKIGWSLTGVVVGLIALGITIYMVFIEDKYPKLQYNILTNTSVLDIKEEVSDLNILYNGVDINKEGLALRVINIQILNNSTKNILKTYYDDNAPLGCSISIGKIIKNEVINASNTYLEKNVKLNLISERELNFSKIIIEAHESFTIKLLVLHPKNEPPSINQIGKIAGIKSVPINDPSIERLSKNISYYLKQTLMFIIASLIFVFGGAFVMFFKNTLFPLLKDRRKRTKNIKAFRIKTNIELTKADEIIFDMYVIEELLLADLFSIFHSYKRLKEAYLEYKNFFIKTGENGFEVSLAIAKKIEKKESSPFYLVSSRYVEILKLINEYKKMGIIRESNSRITLDNHPKETFIQLLIFLRNRKLLSEKTESFFNFQKENFSEFKKRNKSMS